MSVHFVLGAEIGYRGENKYLDFLKPWYIVLNMYLDVAIAKKAFLHVIKLIFKRLYLIYSNFRF